jgi:hypothetical protein
LYKAIEVTLKQEKCKINIQFRSIYCVFSKSTTFERATKESRNMSAATKERHDKRAPRQKSAATKERRDKIA